MARINPIPLDRMTPEQRRLNDEIAGTRGGGPAKGPFALWLRTPELANHANAFGSYLRHSTSVPQNLVELAVLDASPDHFHFPVYVEVVLGRDYFCFLPACPETISVPEKMKAEYAQVFPV